MREGDHACNKAPSPQFLLGPEQTPFKPRFPRRLEREKKQRARRCISSPLSPKSKQSWLRRADDAGVRCAEGQALTPLLALGEGRTTVLLAPIV